MIAFEWQILETCIDDGTFSVCADGLLTMELYITFGFLLGMAVSAGFACLWIRSNK